jgi:hypothetical protein
VRSLQTVKKIEQGAQIIKKGEQVIQTGKQLEQTIQTVKKVEQTAQTVKKAEQTVKTVKKVEQAAEAGQKIEKSAQAVQVSKQAIQTLQVAKQVVPKLDEAKHIALGLDPHLDKFAAQRGGSTWKQWAKADPLNWKVFFKEVVSNPANKVSFDLTGVDVWPGVSRASRGAAGATDWELLQIKNNPQWWDRITFYDKGKVVPNPFK